MSAAELAHNCLYYMFLMREVEDRIERKLYRQGKIVGGVYVGRGQEAIPVGTALVAEPGDVLFPSHRDMAVFLIRGVTAGRILAQYMGRAGGVTGGRDANMHMGDLNHNIVSIISALAATVPVAAGAALALRYQGKNGVVFFLFRRRLHQPRRLARGTELRHRPEAAGGVCLQQQPVRLPDADLPGAITVTPLTAGGHAVEPQKDDEQGRNYRRDDGVLRFSLAGVPLKFSAVMGASGGLTIPAHGVGRSGARRRHNRAPDPARTRRRHPGSAGSRRSDGRKGACRRAL
jgi:hypothetical protein